MIYVSATISLKKKTFSLSGKWTPKRELQRELCNTHYKYVAYKADNRPHADTLLCNEWKCTNFTRDTKKKFHSTYARG